MSFEELVDKERIYQDKLWGEQNHEPDKWLVILMEEIGEMSKAVLDMPASNVESEVERELIQCAAVLKAMWESGKRNGWL